MIAESNIFKSAAYIDTQNRYYLSINYGEGDVITVLQPYSIDLYNEILIEFPNAVGIDFICDGNIGKEFENDGGILYHYKFQGNLNADIKTAQPFTVKLITENDFELAKKYDDLYFSFLPPNHGARMTNQLKNLAGEIKNGKHKIYFAMINDIPIGFIIAEYYHEYNACDFAQITIEEAYQKKGYGLEFLTEVTKDNLKQGYDLYYSGVSGDNIASRKTAEKAGYIIVSGRMSVRVK